MRQHTSCLIAIAHAQGLVGGPRVQLVMLPTMLLVAAIRTISFTRSVVHSPSLLSSFLPPFVRLSVCPSIHHSACLSVRLSVCLSVLCNNPSIDKVVIKDWSNQTWLVYEGGGTHYHP